MYMFIRVQTDEVDVLYPCDKLEVFLDDSGLPKEVLLRDGEKILRGIRPAIDPPTFLYIMNDRGETIDTREYCSIEKSQEGE